MKHRALALLLVAAIATAGCVGGPLQFLEAAYEAFPIDCIAGRMLVTRDAIASRPVGEVFALQSDGTTWMGSRGTIAAGDTLSTILKAWRGCIAARQAVAAEWSRHGLPDDPELFADAVMLRMRAEIMALEPAESEDLPICPNQGGGS